MFDSLVRDIRFGVRMMFKAPGLTCAALLALAIGIGANSTIFSLVNAILLNPLPYENADRLVSVWESSPERERSQTEPSYPNYADWKNYNQVFEDMAAIAPTGFVLTGIETPDQIFGARATASLFRTLGVKPQIGRTFLDEEDKPNGSRVVVISYGLWQRRLGAVQDIVGREIRLNDQSYKIIGVMPPDFSYLPSMDAWTPLLVDSNQTDLDSRGYHHLMVTARLKPGVTLDRAQAELNTIAAQLELQYPESNRGSAVLLSPFRNQFVGEIRGVLIALWIAVGLVLLIACTNIANVSLAHGAARQGEIAIRISMGASRMKLVRQLLTESVILSVAGGILGLGVTQLGIKLILYGVPPNVVQFIPGLKRISIDETVLVFTAGISILTGIIFGLLPAIQVSRPNLNELLKEGNRAFTGGLRQRRIRGILVVCEIVIVLVLLNGVGLALNSFLYLLKINPGFNPTGLLTFRLALPTTKYANDAQIARLYQELQRQLEALPGVLAVGAVSHIPIGSGANSSTAIRIEGRPAATPGETLDVSFRIVTPGYFRTISVPAKSGRTFTDGDSSASLPVTVINETMARKYWPNENPIGKRVSNQTDESGQPIWREIVGVVGNIRHSLESEPRQEMYFPSAQQPVAEMSLVIKTATDPIGMAPAVQNQVWTIDRDLPVSAVKTMEQIIADSVSPQRAVTVLSGLFAAAAFMLVAVGIHGLIAYSVTKRTQEIGIRIALGAQSGTILRKVVGEGMKLVLIGAAIGLLPTYLIGKVLSNALYGASAAAPLTLACVLIMVIGMAALASYFPARRAAKLDPLIALRNS